MADGYDTDEESHAQYTHHMDIEMGTKTPPPPMPAGLVPLDFGGEVNDHGEESYFRAKMLARALRRLDRWEGGRQTSRARPKGERNSAANPVDDVRPVLGSEDEDDDEDNELMEVDELERREEQSDDDEDSEDEEGEPRWDSRALPELMRAG
jgi:Ino eighty subunit 1